MNKSILIVDDMVLNINLLTDILGDEFTIMAALSGELALKLLSRTIPDLVLLDVSMPGIDGFEVLRQMKRNTELSNIPVIFVTGEHNARSEEEGLSLGAVDYVKKPFNRVIVNIKVRNHLMMKEYRDHLEQLVHERTKLLTEKTNQLIERTNQLAASREAIIMGMSLMSESHDKITGGHIERIKAYVNILTQTMLEMYPDVINPETAKQIVLYSPLHDVGKVGISDAVLKKEGFLTQEEFEIMKSHTLMGTDILRKTEMFLADNIEQDGLSVAIDIAQYHHEKYDGSGYPHGLIGEKIPLSARIVALADVYDALRSPRQYKKAFTHAEAMSIILSGDDRTNPKHFDPKILEVFGIVQSVFNEINEKSYSGLSDTISKNILTV